MQKLKLSRGKLYLCVLLLFACSVLLGYFCVWTHDDYLQNNGSFASVLKESLYFGNGRYLGNIIVNVFLPRKIIDAFFRGAVITGIVALSASVAADFSIRTISLSILMFFGFGNLIQGEALFWGHGFYNFAPPVLIILISLQILKDYYLGGKLNRYGLKVSVLFLAGVCQQLFSENTTCIALLIAAALFVLTFRFKKAKGPAAAWLIGSGVGAFLMFALPELMGVAYKMSEYRGSGVGAASLSEFVAQFFDNALVSLDSLAPMFPLWALLSYGLIRLLHSYDGKSRFLKKTKPLFYIVFSLQTFSSFIYLFINGTKLKERIPLTNIRIHDPISKIRIAVCVWLALYLVCVLIVLLKNEKLRGSKPVYFGIAGTAALSVGELLIITVMGPRCLFITACILSVFVIRFFKDEKLADRRLAAVAGCGGLAYVLALILIMSDIWRINNVRFDYAQRQLAEKKEVIEIIKLPHERWLHVPNQSAGYGFYFNYGEVKDEEDYEYITYEEYLSREKQ